MVNNLTAVASRRLAGVTVFAAIALGCALPQVASASGIVWQLNGRQVKEAVAVTSKATLQLKDSKGGFFGESIRVECKVTGKISVGAGATGKVSEWTAAACKTKEGTCETSPTVTALNLPWHTELVTVEGKAREQFSSGGSGDPGYKWICKLGVNDECTGNTSAAVSNVSGGVDLTFDSKSAKLNCAVGGSGAGSIEETELVESPSSGTLTAAVATPEYWYLNGKQLEGQQSVTSSGEFSFTNPSGGPFGETVGVKCATAGVEYVGPESAGEVRSLSATECSNSQGRCETPTVEARNLPWHTELYPVEGKTRERFFSGGSGAPEYRVRCDSGLYENTCAWFASAAVENVSEGVRAQNGYEERSCSHGHGLIGASELISDSSGTLTVD